MSVELKCCKCQQKVMQLVSAVEGITSIVLDPPKNTVTVIGQADPVKIINKVRKFSRTAEIMSIGPAKEEKKDEKKEVKKECVALPTMPFTRTCERCDVWYLVHQDTFGHCSIL